MRNIQLLLCLLMLSGCANLPTRPQQVPSTAEPVERPIQVTVAATEGGWISPDPPAWAENAVIYEIYVRSFADSNGDGIGDLDGIREALDYLEALHIDVIYLMPIYPSPSVHGYDVADFFEVHPQYGTRQDLIELVQAVHERDMHLVLDFVPSHVSNQHPYFQEAYDDPESPHADWFVWLNDSHTKYSGFANSREMPRLNHANPAVATFLTQAALFWMDLDQDGDYTDGVDGFRVDNVTYPPEEFFTTFRQDLKSINPEFLILGEAWLTTPSQLTPYYIDKFDALFDFPLLTLLQGDPSVSGDGILAGRGFPGLLWGVLEEEEQFPPAALVVRFLNNHDTNRIMSEINESFERAQLAPALLATLPGPVLVYYGEEIGMLGEKGGPPHWDSYRREPMQWHEASEGLDQTTWFRVDDVWNQPYDGISVEEQDKDPSSLLNTYRRLLELRRTHSALLGDVLVPLSLELSTSGAWGYIRGEGEQRLFIVYNFATEPNAVTLRDLTFESTVLRDLMSGEIYRIQDGRKEFTLSMLPGSVVVLEQVLSD